jgi:F-type H+-transporting ATPase subunit delta
MTEQRVSFRYAKAVFDLAKSAHNIDTVYKDFMIIRDYLNQSSELLRVLKNPIVKTWQKKNLFKELFKDILSELSYSFIILLAEKNREDLLSDILFSFETMYNTEMNICKADITTSRDLDSELKSKIISELTSKLNKTIIPKYLVEPKIKGGIMVRVEDWVYDASIRNQLSRLRTKLIEGKLV